MPVIPTLRRLDQVHGYKDKITLDYEVRLPTPSKKKNALLGSFVDAVPPWINSLLATLKQVICTTF